MDLKNDIENALHRDPRFSLRYVDKTFWILFAFLIATALIALFSASSTKVYQSASNIGPVAHQALFIFIGVLFAAVIQFLPTWVIRLFGYGGWVVFLLMLYVMLLPHNPFVVTINGAGRWFKILGIAFQPSEFAKIGLMIVVADQLARAEDDESMKKAFFRTLFITLVTIFPILVGNLSTAILMAMVVFLVWIIAGVKFKYLALVFVCATAFFVLGYLFVDYTYVKPKRTPPALFARATLWVKRINDTVDERKQKRADEASGTVTFKITDDNYQRSIAKVAVARGGVSPFGVLPGNSRERDYLPLAYADYIFAIIVEETGFMGALGLIFLYMAILFRACFVSSRFGNMHAMLLTMGLALMLTCQALISMFVAVGIGPVTGQPLPMITMGGTSSLATALYFGIMMAVSREQNQISGEQEDVRRESMANMPDIEA